MPSCPCPSCLPADPVLARGSLRQKMEMKFYKTGLHTRFLVLHGAPGDSPPVVLSPLDCALCGSSLGGVWRERGTREIVGGVQ